MGIVLQIDKYKYFVPLYSYKRHYDKYKNNASFFFVYGKNPLSIIKFLSMIPVPNNMRVVNLLDYKKQEKKYQDLLSSEYKYINFHKKEILQRAKRMYTFVTNDKQNFLKTISCNFKNLQEKSLEYSEKFNLNKI